MAAQSALTDHRSAMANGTAREENGMNQLRLDWADRGKMFQVHVGDLIRVSLWGNATTGFFWSPVPTGADAALEQVDDRQTGPPDSLDTEPPIVLGAGSTHQMAFQARRPGTEDLTIRYWRGTEAPEDVIYQVTIEVLEDS
jgi:predicted secreted protein